PEACPSQSPLWTSVSSSPHRETRLSRRTAIVFLPLREVQGASHESPTFPLAPLFDRPSIRAIASRCRKQRRQRVEGTVARASHKAVAAAGHGTDRGALRHHVARR